MPESMIERVTRALLRQRLLNLGHLPGPTLEAAINAEWREFTAFARIALIEMRQPTEAMLHADGETLKGGRARVDSYLAEHSAEAVWQAMIDAALAEEA